MRDPDRIPRVIKKLQEVWEKFPDLRLGQLVDNARMCSQHNYVDVFSIEDDAIEEGLEFIDKELK